MVCVGVAVKRTMYQRKVDEDMLNAVKSVLADVSSACLALRQSKDNYLRAHISAVHTSEDTTLCLDHVYTMPDRFWGLCENLSGTV